MALPCPISKSLHWFPRFSNFSPIFFFFFPSLSYSNFFLNFLISGVSFSPYISLELSSPFCDEDLWSIPRIKNLLTVFLPIGFENLEILELTFDQRLIREATPKMLKKKVIILDWKFFKNTINRIFLPRPEFLIKNQISISGSRSHEYILFFVKHWLFISRTTMIKKDITSNRIVSLRKRTIYELNAINKKKRILDTFRQCTTTLWYSFVIAVVSSALINR